MADEPQMLHYRLPVVPDSAAVLRRELRAVDDLTDRIRPDLELLLTELMTNVVRHAGLGAGRFMDVIVRIDPASGRVTGIINLSALAAENGDASDRVLNGIAYDPQGDRLFVTGKNWAHLYEIDLVPSPQTP